MTFQEFAMKYFTLVTEMANARGPKVPGTIVYRADLEPDSALNQLIVLAHEHPEFNTRIEEGEGTSFCSRSLVENRMQAEESLVESAFKSYVAACRMTREQAEHFYTWLEQEAQEDQHDIEQHVHRLMRQKHSLLQALKMLGPSLLKRVEQYLEENN